MSENHFYALYYAPRLSPCLRAVFSQLHIYLMICSEIPEYIFLDQAKTKKFGCCTAALSAFKLLEIKRLNYTACRKVVLKSSKDCCETRFTPTLRSRACSAALSMLNYPTLDGRLVEVVALFLFVCLY